MVCYEDLSDEEKSVTDSKVSKIMEPFEKRGIVKQQNRNGKRLWGTSASQSKLMQAVVKGLKNKGGNPNSLIINGQNVLLALLPFVMFYKASDEETDSKIDEYLKELDSN
jgi:hypothetical protein